MARRIRLATLLSTPPPFFYLGGGQVLDRRQRGLTEEEMRHLYCRLFLHTKLPNLLLNPYNHSKVYHAHYIFKMWK